MDSCATGSKCEGAVSFTPGTSHSSGDYKTFHSMGIPSLPQGDAVVEVNHCQFASAPILSDSISATTASNSLERSISRPNCPQYISFGSLSQSTRFSRDTAGHGARQLRNNAGKLRTNWFLIETNPANCISQIIMTIIVLSWSRNEIPRDPLRLWLIGYACGRLAMLPVIYWRDYPQLIQSHDQDRISAPSSSGTLPLHTLQPGEELEGADAVHDRGKLRSMVHLKRLSIAALAWFFGVWFAIASVWAFRGDNLSQDAPYMYRLCLFFLAVSGINYAMRFITRATLYFCQPCAITTFILYGENGAKVKGAAPEVIAGLPIYRFKTKELQIKDEDDSECESLKEGVFFSPGTGKERVVSGEEAVCCICLGRYRDGVDLKELQCSHFFHAQCLDKWLKINATCPVCKRELSSSSADQV